MRSKKKKDKEEGGGTNDGIKDEGREEDNRW